MSNIGHIQEQSTVKGPTLQDSVEAKQALAKQERSKRTGAAMKQHGTLPHQKAANQQAQTPQQLTGQNRSSAAEQVSAEELAEAVGRAALTTRSRRPHEKPEKNKACFKALTKQNLEALTIHVKSLADSITKREKLRSKIDTAFKDSSPQERAFMKVVAIEIALADPVEYGLSKSDTVKLEKVRNELMEKHAEFIETKRIEIEVSGPISRETRVPLKQLIATHQINHDNELSEITALLKKLTSSPNSDIYAVLESHIKHWVALGSRETSQIPDVTKFRQFKIQKSISDLKKIRSGLEKADHLKEVVMKSPFYQSTLSTTS